MACEQRKDVKARKSSELEERMYGRKLYIIYIIPHPPPPLTNEGAANDLKGELQQVLGDGCDPGKRQFLSVSIICIEDTDLLLADFQHHCTVPVVVTYSEGGKHLFCK